jgi:hypothetical protein
MAVGGAMTLARDESFQRIASLSMQGKLTVHVFHPAERTIADIEE